MTKKDEKDADRPHYYSQFWLDVAAGRRVIGTPRTEEGSDQTEAEMPEPVSAARKAAGRAASVDGYQETRSPSAAEPAYEEEYSEPEEEVDLASDLNDEDIPNIVVEDFPEEDLVSLEPAPIDEEEEAEELDEEDEFFDEEDEEEDDEWAARGRKKPKPGRQVKQPKPPVKKPKRGGRGF
jgi:hypothetical protein